ncbi:DNA gyrase subunit B [endosymbiont of Sipalinus gigas]|uniref:DNA gyrase subunit B n=1 Tax=endosymbiont of Sipalinus gigas TaxID=1972134 RepID=UPI000DC6DE0E|nr:DNA gyrase subunit B [endosymbiont of Sipalinus gigas]BBA85161.1 DNA gyrase subunit B [endosymbiont of Sipalinus gigas]
MNNYDSSSIKILKGLEAVRKRPGMYIGNTYDGTGLHHMFFEVIDNSIDEVLSGYCTEINVILYDDNSISVEDNGRGIPIDIYKDENISSAELIMTTLHSGGKFDNLSYKISGGLHGVGISVVNALSKKLKLQVYRNNNIYEQNYIFGNPEDKLNIIGKTNKIGTFIKFLPDNNIFLNNNKFQYNIIFEKLNELSFLNPNLNINLYYEKKDLKYNFNNKDGIKSFINELSKNKVLINQKIFYFKSNKNDISIEVALQWINGTNETIYCFTNNIKQKDGGTHLSGLKSSITKTINSYINKELINKVKNISIIGEDTREGILGIISLKFSNPKFSSQTKDKLISSEIRSIIESIISENLMEFLLENIDDAKHILNKIIQSARIRESTKRTKDIIRKNIQNNNELFNLVGKLSNCQEKNPILSELYLVEGDSAGGSAKQGRNRKNQAILPLKGKILNVEKASFDKLISSKEILSLITALGCGINKNEFNIEKLKYHKIIIMTDADIDGAHIRTLLLTFFYRYMPDLINKGHIYIAQPPLYKIKKNKFEKYLINNDELVYYQIKLSIKNLLFININNEILDKEYVENILLDFYKIINIIKKLLYKFSNFILECLLYFEYILDIKSLDEYEKLNEWSDKFIKFINLKSNSKYYNYYIKKNLTLNNYEIIIVENINNISNKYIINHIFLNSNEYNLFTLFNKKIYNKIIKGEIIVKNLNDKIYFKTINYLLNWIIEKSYEEIYIQRYKGLGEMNPKQLWNTTMNPDNRHMLKVIIKDNKTVNELFSILMGDLVEPRKNFIEKYYVFADNIDI